MAYRGYPSRGSLADHFLRLLSPDLRSSLEHRVSEFRRLGIKDDEWEFNVKPLLTPLTVRSVTARLVKRILRPSEDVEVQAIAMFTPVMLSSLDTILTFVHWGSSKYKLFYETTFEADKVNISPFGILWSSEFKDIDVTKISGLPLDAYIVNTIRFPKVTSLNEIEPLTDTTFMIVGDRDVSIYTIYKSVCKLVGDVRESRFKGRDYRNVLVEFVDRSFRVRRLLMDMPVEDLEVIRGRAESFNALIVREDLLVEGGRRRGPLYTVHLLDLARVSGFRVGDVELPLELFEFLRDEYMRSEGLVSFKLDILKLRNVLSNITRYFRKGSNEELWVRVLNDNEFLKLMINSTGIYRVKGDSVVYFNPLIAEFILAQGGALSIDVRAADVPFEIALAMEEFSREIKAYDPGNPLNILRLKDVTRKLKDRFEHVLGIRVRDEGIIHKLNGLLYHSKVYNVVVEGVSG
ncbi:MAG: hypothetical protein ACO2O2_13010 [Acidilobaceae archaeon]